MKKKFQLQLYIALQKGSQKPNICYFLVVSCNRNNYDHKWSILAQIFIPDRILWYPASCFLYQLKKKNGEKNVFFNSDSLSKNNLIIIHIQTIWLCEVISRARASYHVSNSKESFFEYYEVIKNTVVVIKFIIKPEGLAHPIVLTSPYSENNSLYLTFT